MSTDSARGTQRPPADGPSVPQSTPVERPSALRIFASALAAMTATALLSTLGVAGTIVGAAIASVITVLANFVYSASLQRTADKVTYVTAIQRERIRQTRSGSLQVDGEAPTDQLVDETAAAAAVELDPTQVTVAEPPERAATERVIAKPAEDTSKLSRLRAALRSAVNRFGWRRIVGTIVAVFVLTLAAVTFVELAAGKPLVDVVRNQEGSGTSVFGGTTNQAPEEDVRPGPGDVSPPAPQPTETPTPTETPQPTETPDAPATPEPTEEPAPLEETPTTPPVEPEQPPPPGEGAPDPELPPTPGADAAPQRVVAS